MSVVRLVTITCDGCHKEYDGGSWSADEIRTDARQHEWRTSLPGGRDFCPNCQSGAVYAAEQAKSAARRREQDEKRYVYNLSLGRL